MVYRFFSNRMKFQYLFFNQIAQVVVSSRLLEEMCYNQDPDYIKKCLAIISKAEERGAEISREISRQLDRTFITPIDRKDIHEINKATDRVLDIFKQLANRISIYSFIPIPQPAKKIVTNLKIMVENIEYMFKRLKNKRYDVIDHLIEVKKAKKVADMILVEVLSVMCRHRILANHELLRIVRWSRIYNRLERAICRVDDLAEVIEGAMLKNI